MALPCRFAQKIIEIVTPCLFVQHAGPGIAEDLGDLRGHVAAENIALSFPQNLVTLDLDLDILLWNGTSAPRALPGAGEEGPVTRRVISRPVVVPRPAAPAVHHGLTTGNKAAFALFLFLDSFAVERPLYGRFKVPCRCV